MSYWSGSSFEGQEKDGWYHGKGRFFYPDGIIYQGQFDKGQFHGVGTLIYPNGVNIFYKGRYKAKWERGKMITGQYFFEDNLQYQKLNWNYSVPDDRQYYQEKLNGIKPSGATQMTRQDIPHSIPKGTYGKQLLKDAGEGYYQPIKSIIYKYNGQILRTPKQEQVQNIIKKCRYNPRELDISGQDDKVIKLVVMNQQKNLIH